MIENLIKSLNFRIELIEDAYQQTLSTDKENKKSLFVNYHMEVAFFIHYVFTNINTKQLYQELLKYDELLSEKTEYKNLIEQITSTIRDVANTVLMEIGIENIPKDAIDGWKNPFKIGEFSNAISLLRQFSDYRELPTAKHSTDLSEIYQVLTAFFNRWDSYETNTNWEKTLKLMQDYQKYLAHLEYLTGFLKEQIGAQGAIRLFNLYRAVNPLGIPKSTNENIFHGLVASGNELTDDKIYVTDCKKLNQYLQQKLSEGYSIDISINQFKTFMENFRNANEFPKGEKQLQKEFETFLFQKGYFPLSEIQLKNGRLDTLAINESNSFVVEYKQIGWNKNSEILKNEVNKIVSSFIQTEIYSSRLEGLESLQKTIYVIIFTKEYFVFQNSNNVLNYNGKSFKFFLVYMGETVPSKIKEFEKINLEEIIKNEHNILYK